MAAAEYFSTQPMTSSSFPHPHTSSHPPTYNYSPQPASSPYQQQGAPPPYQEYRPGVHFAPEPVEPPQRHSFSGQRPQFSSPQPLSYGPPALASQMSLQQPQQYQQPLYSSYQKPAYGTPPKPQFLSPHMRPHANPNSSQYSLANGGYASDPEEHHRRRRRRKDSGEFRSAQTKSRSKNTDAFLGAAGGGLIGDLIFPGLGTVGGAALGWLGGKDYGNHRKDREDRRHKEQRKWEDKFQSGHRRDHSRGSSTDIGEYESSGRRSSHHR